MMELFAKVVRQKINAVNYFRKKNPSYNLGQNIWRLFHVLAQFLFAAGEMELDYYHKKVSVRVASRVAKGFKT